MDCALLHSSHVHKKIDTALSSMDKSNEQWSPGHHKVCQHLDVVMIFETVLDVTQELKDVKPVKKKKRTS